MKTRVYILYSLLALCLWAPFNSSAAAPAVEFRGSVNKIQAELGDSILYTLDLKVTGNLSMRPTILKPDFEKAGFALREPNPRSSSSSSLINGRIIQQVRWQWEIAPVRSGSLTIPSAHFAVKDAQAGEIRRSTAAIKVMVPRPSKVALPPTPTPLPLVTPGLNSLRPIKPDLGVPWLRLTALLLALLSVLALIIGFALKAPKPKKIKVVRDPAQVALFDLEQALRLLKKGEEQAYYKECSRLYREYLRHKLRPDADALTLLDAKKEAALSLRRSGGREASLQEAQRLPERLQQILYGNQAAKASDAQLIPGGIRLVILELENRSITGAANQAWADLKCLEFKNEEEAVKRLKEILSAYLSARFGERVREELQVERAHFEIRAIQSRHEARMNEEVSQIVSSMRGKSQWMASALLDRRGYTAKENPQQWIHAAKQFLKLMEPPDPQTGKNRKNKRKS